MGNDKYVLFFQNVVVIVLIYTPTTVLRRNAVEDDRTNLVGSKHIQISSAVNCPPYS